MAEVGFISRHGGRDGFLQSDRIKERLYFNDFAAQLILPQYLERWFSHKCRGGGDLFLIKEPS